MNLVASLVVRNELQRYLLPCVQHLTEFCDDVRVYDDGSTDGTQEVLAGLDRVSYRQQEQTTFFTHEGETRARALNFAREANPTHMLAIDADEFISDGAAFRKVVEGSEQNVLTLHMEEVWKADPAALYTREDGGWKQHGVPIVWRVTRQMRGPWQMPNRALACGRTPTNVVRNRRTQATGVSILHFGWANLADRQARYERYIEADGGRFHASQHLKSIMFPDNRVILKQREWPAALDPYRSAIARRAAL